MQKVGLYIAGLFVYATLVSACVVIPRNAEVGAMTPTTEAAVPNNTGETFTVEPEPLPESVYYTEEPEVLVPVIVGQPVYYPPPMAVTYAYDYFTYEQVGVFVNVVFWKDGRRQRSEVWYDHGRRMTVKRMRAQGHMHKVRASEARHHRERLERDHRNGTPTRTGRDKKHESPQGKPNNEHVGKADPPQQRKPTQPGLLRASMPQKAQGQSSPAPQQPPRQGRHEKQPPKPTVEQPQTATPPQGEPQKKGLLGTTMHR